MMFSGTCPVLFFDRTRRGLRMVNFAHSSINPPKAAPLMQMFLTSKDGIHRGSKVRTKVPFGGFTGRLLGNICSNDIPIGTEGVVTAVRRKVDKKDHSEKFSYEVRFTVKTKDREYSVRQMTTIQEIELLSE